MPGVYPAKLLKKKHFTQSLGSAPKYEVAVAFRVLSTSDGQTVLARHHPGMDRSLVVHQEAPNCHNMSARLGSKGGKAGGVRDFSFKEDLHCTALYGGDTYRRVMQRTTNGQEDQE